MVEVLSNAVLILIDVQKGFSNERWGNRNNPHAELRMTDILGKFREHNLKVIHVRHDSTNPDSLLFRGKDTFEFKNCVAPLENELIVTKHVNSAFIGTSLEKILRGINAPQVFYMGLVTDHCVSTTVRMSGNLGFNSYVIEDACATHDRMSLSGKIIDAQTVHEVNLASLNGEFATVIQSEELDF